MSENHWNIFITFFITGLFLGIFLVTGFDISPDGLAVIVGDAFFSILPLTQFGVLWELLKLSILFIGLLILAVGIYRVIEEGPSYIASAILGFLAGISLLFSPQIFVICLIIGGIISRFLD